MLLKASKRCYIRTMEKILDNTGALSFEREFEREIAMDDDTASREILASGMPIHIARDDTPAGHVIRIYPDGREELIRFDRDEAERVLGR
jgi:hypothetical protein